MNKPTDVLTLLNTWNLKQLLPHFRDEGVGMNELMLMKYHHIKELLQNFKLGVRITFEHHFELWRREINKPLLTNYTPQTIVSQSGQTIVPHQLQSAAVPKRSSATNTERRPLRSSATNTEHYSLQHVSTDTDGLLPTLSPLTVPSLQPATKEIPKKVPVPLSTVPPPPPLSTAPPPLARPSHASRELITSRPPCKVVVQRLPKLTPQPALLLENGNSESAVATSNRSSPLLSPMQLLGFSLDATLRSDVSLESMPPGFEQALNSDDTRNTTDRIKLSLEEILRNSGVMGLNLLQYYQEHQELRHNQRAMLIQLIVNYFDMHNYHLSLNVSHNLEKQILRLFPTERLENYRTEKRGKIYVKFCNMKRYKRDPPRKRRKVKIDVSVADEPPLFDFDTNFPPNNYEVDWQNPQEDMEAIVKAEVLSDDDILNLNDEMPNLEDFNDEDSGSAEEFGTQHPNSREEAGPNTSGLRRSGRIREEQMQKGKRGNETSLENKKSRRKTVAWMESDRNLAIETFREESTNFDDSPSTSQSYVAFLKHGNSTEAIPPNSLSFENISEEQNININQRQPGRPRKQFGDLPDFIGLQNLSELERKKIIHRWKNNEASRISRLRNREKRAKEIEVLAALQARNAELLKEKEEIYKIEKKLQRAVTNQDIALIP